MSSRVIKIIIGFLIVVAIGIGSIFARAIFSGKTNVPQAGTSRSVFGTLFSLFNGPASNESTSSSSPTATIEGDNGAVVAIPKLRQISASPVSGAVFFQRNVATATVDALGQVKNVTLLQTFMRYFDRATGHIFETKPDSLIVKEITNTTLPRIYQAIFTNQADSLVLRYLDVDKETINTSYALVSTTTATTTSISLGATTNPKTLFTYLLPKNLTELTLSPDRAQIFYTQNGGQGGIGVVALPNNTKTHQIFNFPLKDWLIDWPKQSTITLTTKPSAYVPGFLFFLNSSNGALTKILGNVPGMTTLTSPDTNNVLFSESTAANFTLNVYNLKTDRATTLSLKTLPEKCVWSQKSAGIVYCAVPLGVPKGRYPDTWYQGNLFFTDNFWKINIATGERSLVARTIDLTKQAIDATNLRLDPTENYLMFINKRDLTLWNLLVATPSGPIFSTSTPAVIATSTKKAVNTSTSTPFTPPSR